MRKEINLLFLSSLSISTAEKEKIKQVKNLKNQSEEVAEEVAEVEDDAVASDEDIKAFFAEVNKT